MENELEQKKQSAANEDSCLSQDPVCSCGQTQESVESAPESAPVTESAAPPVEESACTCMENTETEIPCREREERPAIPVTQEMLDDAREKLAMMLDFLSLDGTVRAESGPSKINLTVSSKDAGRIIGRKGQSLENLQLLLNRMMQKNSVNYPKIYIDIDGYSSGTKRAPGMDGENSARPERREHMDRSERRGGRSERRDHRDHRDRSERRGGRFARGGNGTGENSGAREEQLRMLALDSAKEVRKWGDPKTLPEMNSHDRRIVHLALEGEPDLSTESIGEEPHKSVVISLKK